MKHALAFTTAGADCRQQAQAAGTARNIGPDKFRLAGSTAVHGLHDPRIIPFYSGRLAGFRPNTRILVTVT